MKNGVDVRLHWILSLEGTVHVPSCWLKLVQEIPENI